MGNYSYICKCGKPIREGEQVHLIHIRHGEVLGHAEGTFNGYGTVFEDEGFDNASFDKWDGVSSIDPNCHDEVIKSKFKLDDSLHKCYARKKLYQGKPVDEYEYCDARGIKYKWPEGTAAEFNEACKEYKKLEDAPMIPPKSGIVAYHKACYDTARAKNNIDLAPSDPDPDQGWGEPCQRFM